MYTNVCSHHSTKFYFHNSQLQRFLYYQKVYNNPFSLLILWYLPQSTIKALGLAGFLQSQQQAWLQRALRELMWWHQVQQIVPMPWDSSSQLWAIPAAPAGQHMGRDGIQWPASPCTPGSPERTPRKAAPSQVHHTQGVLHSLISSFPIPSSLCAFTAAQPSPLRPWQLSCLTAGCFLGNYITSVAESIRKWPQKTSFLCKSKKGSWWNHRGNTIFSVSTLAHGTSCHRVIPGQTVWQPPCVCSAQLRTSSRERNRNKWHPLDESCLFFPYFGVILREKYLENELPRGTMLWSLGNQSYKVRTHFSDCPSRTCLPRGVCMVSLHRWCIKVFKKMKRHSIKHHPEPQDFCKASGWS